MTCFSSASQHNYYFLTLRLERLSLLLLAFAAITSSASCVDLRPAVWISDQLCGSQTSCVDLRPAVWILGAKMT